MKHLRYHDGTLMRWDPVNLKGERLLDQFRSDRQVHVVLEPGDASRYDLLVTWLPALRGAFNLSPDAAQQGLLVTRLVGGHAVGSALIGWFNHGGVRDIANRNAWSGELLDWWCRELINRLAPEYAEANA